MNNPKTGDLVFIIDPDGEEPIKMGVGLVVGEAKKHVFEHARWPWKTAMPVLWGGRVEYLDIREWMFEVISEASK
tara:strand:+ start:1580 stop:1804 length:225 start_codon:yes stop_codon:yes gene_type:complete